MAPLSINVLLLYWPFHGANKKRRLHLQPAFLESTEESVPHSFVAISWPARVTSLANSRISILSLIHFTEPSPMQKLAPPE